MSDTSLSSLAFFRELHGHYGQALSHWRAQPKVLDAILQIAWHSFEDNVQLQCEGLPDLDCHKGCATCCTLRVTATAPEMLMLARFIRAVHPALMARGIDLPARVADVDARTQGLSESGRVAARQPCPFVAQGVCVIYPVRPLACRGLASYDRRVCAQAASGRVDAIPYSEPHMRVRSVVQNALQSALRDAQLTWGSYELNQALTMALRDASLEQRWLSGEDVLHPAQVHEVDPAEMAHTFDRIRALA
ncbi:MAG TPA: YkgJ family cysteine cluster protein [Aquabacterium sp.]|uniref:YkgJ family cysteine cluster protein n=1 Tax=Aquabacterium sp. TaxID=1872578 RepID=UPI002E30AE80|nr:YkgJ family cysteine cluster protein [Aquabacterium sp.]HEX5373886.1 YkgJ family cysteine cluster protein [Aquabacterium sp.]